MKNILEYNEFKSYKEYNLITEATGTDDKYAENVRGNFAGAETTLIGSGIIKLFGFIKRKGMQAYLKTVLKPRLGKQYFNGILRYVARNRDKVTLPPEKSKLSVMQLTEDNTKKEVIRVSAKKDALVGMEAFVNGAILTKDDGKLLEDGTYTEITIVYSKFDVKDGIISNLNKGTEEPIEEETTENTDVQSEFTKEKTEADEYIKKTKDEIGDTAADKEIIEYCNQITNKYKTVDNVDKQQLLEIIPKIASECQALRTLGLEEIERTLKNENLESDQRNELELNKKSYQANILELTMVQAHLISLLEQYNELHKNESFTVDGDMLTEVVNTPGAKNMTSTTSTNTPKVSDEIKELDGKTVDFNDPAFYKQFEQEETKTAVTNIILENKTDIVKIQLQAERIFGDSKKLKNNWDRMVQDVLGKYSKFMITDTVNPETLRKNEQASNINKMNTQINGAVKKASDINAIAQLDKSENFKKYVEKLTSLDKMVKGTVGTLSADINGVNKLWVYEMGYIMTTEKMVVYRILGYIDNIDEMAKETGKDFSKYVNTNINEMFGDKPDHDGRKLIGIYIFGGKKNITLNGASANNCVISLLYSKSSPLDFEDSNPSKTDIFKIKNRGSNVLSPLYITTIKQTDVKNYQSKINGTNIALYRFNEPGDFIKYDRIKLTKLSNPQYITNINNILKQKVE